MNVLTLLLLTLSSSLSLGQPPVVVSVHPEHGDVAIDPSTSEIRITFDQDMDPSGRSICGGGPTFPAITSAPRWHDARTIIIPVKLEPNHAYDLSINCSSAQNFRGINLLPARIAPVSFRTGDAQSEPPPPPTREANADALAALRLAIKERYSYRDLRVKDWDAAFAPHEPALLAAPSAPAFARRAALALSQADDLHLWLTCNFARFDTSTSSVDWNINVNALHTRLIPDLVQHNRFVSSGRIGDVGYILIRGLPGDPASLKPAHDALDSVFSLPWLIVDLRANGGGDELAARRFAAHLARRDAVYSKSRLVDPALPSGLTDPIDRPLRKVDPAFTGRVIVLSGPGCVSSAESFLLMLRHAADAVVIGGPSRGSSGNPKPHSLGNGVTVFLPSWQDLEPDGTLVEGRGVQPDIPVNFTGRDRDEVLDAALHHIKTAKP